MTEMTGTLQMCSLYSSATTDGVNHASSVPGRIHWITRGFDLPGMITFLFWEYVWVLSFLCLSLDKTVIQAKWTHPCNLSALPALLPAFYVLLHVLGLHSGSLPNLTNGVLRYYFSREACHPSLDIHLYFNRESGRPQPLVTRNIILNGKIPSAVKGSGEEIISQFI